MQPAWFGVLGATPELGPVGFAAAVAEVPVAGAVDFAAEADELTVRSSLPSTSVTCWTEDDFAALAPGT